MGEVSGGLAGDGDSCPCGSGDGEAYTNPGLPGAAGDGLGLGM